MKLSFIHSAMIATIPTFLFVFGLGGLPVVVGGVVLCWWLLQTGGNILYTLPLYLIMIFFVGFPLLIGTLVVYAVANGSYYFTSKDNEKMTGS